MSSSLGKKVTPQLAQELGSRLSARIEGTCIKHHMGSASVKIYDKSGRALRIETTERTEKAKLVEKLAGDARSSFW
ncbi:MAG: hypothetical protein PHT15_04375 [Gallionellaceae bacterium]|nr:hypothetical protein [Gallionellaceae bacterium]